MQLWTLVFMSFIKKMVASLKLRTLASMPHTVNMSLLRTTMTFWIVITLNSFCMLS